MNYTVLFDSELATLAGVLHYLAVDLFLGIWIARNADQHGIPRSIQIPILRLTLVLGPVALLVYLLVRQWKSADAERFVAPA